MGPRLIALVADVDYATASRTALDLAGNDGLRALAPEPGLRRTLLARAQVGLAEPPKKGRR